MDWGATWLQGMGSDMTTNMRVLQPSRVKPRQGDVFVLGVGERFLYGRVVSTQAMAGWSMPGSILIYLFRTESPVTDLPDRSVLGTDNLLVSPMMTNKLPWSRGYFQTVANLPLADGEVLPRHCFQSTAGRYFDEVATELPGPIEPCGDWGLHSFRTIDDEVSDTLLIPRASAD